jgi:hypothetical protein
LLRRAAIRRFVPEAEVAGHFALMPANLMIGHHLSISAFCNAPSA